MFTFLISFHLEVFQIILRVCTNFLLSWGARRISKEFPFHLIVGWTTQGILIIILLFLKAITGFSTHHPAPRRSWRREGRRIRRRVFRNLEPNNIIIMPTISRIQAIGKYLPNVYLNVLLRVNIKFSVKTTRRTTLDTETLLLSLLFF